VAIERGWAIVSAKNGGSKAIKPNYYLEQDEQHIWLHSRDKMAALKLNKDDAPPAQLKLVFSEFGFYEMLNVDSGQRVKCDDLFGKATVTESFKLLLGGAQGSQQYL